jgi:hypothetical protein
MSATDFKSWLRLRVRRGWLAVDRWLMPDVGAELAGLDRTSPRLRSEGGTFGRATGPRFERRKGGLEKRAGAAREVAIAVKGG